MNEKKIKAWIVTVFNIPCVVYANTRAEAKFTARQSAIEGGFRCDNFRGIKAKRFEELDNSKIFGKEIPHEGIAYRVDVFDKMES